jgi:hypothetical protein
MVVFRDGELAPGRVLKAGARAVTIQLRDLVLEAPTEALTAFRLREAHADDDLFESDLNAPVPPARDVVYARRGAGLLRVEGVFQSLDDEFLTLELEGTPRRMRRQSVLGVILSPVASSSVESGTPAVFELRGGCPVPAYLVGIRPGNGTEVLLRFRGASPGSVAAIDTKHIERVKLSSDRVLFLSSVEPAAIEETPFIGTQSPFPWRKDLAAAGGPLQLAGKTYRKGLGVHSRSALDFDLGGRYQGFAAWIGLDDAASAEAGVTFRVLADGKEIFKKDVSRSDTPEAVLLPVPGVKRLRLEVDFGEDGTDFGDHADWADARVTK